MYKVRLYIKISVSLIAATALFYIAMRQGLSALEQRPTDEVSERLAIREAEKLAIGEHSYGIVEYTHYPNGPQYVLTLMMNAGIREPRALRSAPLVFSALSIAILGFCVSMVGASVVLSALGVAGVSALLSQPGVIQWMGALYGNSYSLALCFAGLGLCLLARGAGWAALVLGFFSGWMGYDFTFCFIGVVVVARLLVVDHSFDMRSVLKSVFLAGGVASLGVFAAIVTHLTQNALYFGSVKMAFNDLIGSAAARAGLPISSTLNPEYANFIRSAAIAQGKGQDGEYSRWSILADLWNSFMTPEWSNDQPVAVLFYVALALSGCIFLVGWARTRSLRFAAVPTLLTIGALALSIVFGVAWFVLMPQHARFHFHFIQRQLFVPILLAWICLWHFGNRLRSAMRDNNDRWYLL